MSLLLRGRVGGGGLGLLRRAAAASCRGLSANPATSASVPEPGQTVSGAWKVLSTREVPEFNLTGVELTHQGCGAKYLHLAAPHDHINAFSGNFRTVPMDSSGISHVLEHCVLCGSERFPVRDPFFKMLSRSLATFMNAMTGPDYTLYPFASPNAADFRNLLSVYLDAVFAPMLKEEDFRQEGWRLEQENLSDPNSRLMIKGVVFNEMKGVFADPHQLFGRHLLSAILPSHTYGNCSGGLPERIPQDLTWQKLREFHAKHYSPANARFISYGNLPLEGHLEALEPYLASAPKAEPVPQVPNEPSWSEARQLEISCAPDPSSPDTSTLAVAFKACDITDTYEIFTLQILSELLTDGSSAPFYKSLLEGGLGTAFAPVTGYGPDTKDTLFTVGVQGMSEQSRDRVLEVIENTFQDAYEEGFPEERIAAILHRTELGLKMQSNNFGIRLIMTLTAGWNHQEDQSPLELLAIQKNVDRFKKDLEANPSFLQEKLKEYFIDNNHKLVMVMSPSQTYVKEQEEKLAKIESKMVKKLDGKDRAVLLEKGRELELSQQAKEDLSILPSLKVSDIPERLPSYEFKQTAVAGVPLQLSVQPTNEVSYFRALLNIGSLPDELRQHLSLFSAVLSSMGAGQYDYRQLETQADLCTGGLSSSVHVAEAPGDLAEIRESLLLASHCLERNADKMFHLWSEIFNGFKWENPDRLRTLVSEMAAAAVNGVPMSGHHYAMGEATSGLQPGFVRRSDFAGLRNMRLLVEISRSDGKLDEAVEKIGQISKHLLNKERMKIALNCTQVHASEFVKSTETFLNSVPGDFNAVTPVNVEGFAAKDSKMYCQTSFPVHYCSMAVPTVPYTHEDFAALRVASKLLSLKFLHKEIREKGGAYGGGAVLDSGGALTFYSYRDPNFEKTLEAFESSLDFAKSGSYDAKDVDEAKLGVFQKVDEPVLPGARGLREFLSGVDVEMLHEHRRQVRAVRGEDIRRVVEKYLAPQRVRGVAVIGPPKEVGQGWRTEALV